MFFTEEALIKYCLHQCKLHYIDSVFLCYIYSFLMMWFEKKGDFQEIFLEHLIIPFALASSGDHEPPLRAMYFFPLTSLSSSALKGWLSLCLMSLKHSVELSDFPWSTSPASYANPISLFVSARYQCEYSIVLFQNNFQCRSLVAPFPSSFQHKTNIFPEGARSLPQPLILPVVGIRWPEAIITRCKSPTSAS